MVKCVRAEVGVGKKMEIARASGVKKASRSPAEHCGGYDAWRGESRVAILGPSPK